MSRYLLRIRRCGNLNLQKREDYIVNRIITIKNNPKIPDEVKNEAENVKNAIERQEPGETIEFLYQNLQGALVDVLVSSKGKRRNLQV